MVSFPNPLSLIPGASDILKEAYDKITGWVKGYIGAPFLAVYSVLVTSRNSIVAIVSLVGEAIEAVEGEWRIFLQWGPLIVFRWLLLLLEFQAELVAHSLTAVINKLFFIKENDIETEARRSAMIRWQATHRTPGKGA